MAFLHQAATRALKQALEGLPQLTGPKIRLHFRPNLRVVDGRIVSGGDRGHEVHAGSHLRGRYIVLDSDLLADPPELRRILVHELFHFVWPRLSNATRASWELLLLKELAAGARGELGWSAEWRKAKLEAVDIRQRSRRWRDYVCESFCDTVAAVLSGQYVHEEFTLAPKFARRRRSWVRRFLAANAELPV